MKLAREIAEATFGKFCHLYVEKGQRYWIMCEDIIKQDEIETIVAAKLEPVKEALGILLSVEEYDTINYAFDSDSIKECRDALAMFDN